jgi:hypothetical protein
VAPPCVCGSRACERAPVRPQVVNLPRAGEDRLGLPHRLGSTTRASKIFATIAAWRQQLLRLLRRDGARSAPCRDALTIIEADVETSVQNRLLQHCSSSYCSIASAAIAALQQRLLQHCRSGYCSIAAAAIAALQQQLLSVQNRCGIRVTKAGRPVYKTRQVLREAASSSRRICQVGLDNARRPD